jgi:hypothetical protein
MDFNAGDGHHEEFGNHFVAHQLHRLPLPVLLERTYDSMDTARQSIKQQLQDSGLPSATKFANRIRYCLVCPKNLSNTTQQCDFIVTARLQKNSGLVKVIKCNLMHSCGITLEASTFRPSGDWVCRQVNDLMRDVPHATPAVIWNHINRRFGVTPSYQMAWSAGYRTRKSLSTDEEMSFQLIGPFFNKLRCIMNGTIAVMERDTEKRLLRTFVMLSPLMEALLYCKPILSFDACALKGKYKGVLMAATMIDGAGQILPLAWGTAQMSGSLPSRSHQFIASYISLAVFFASMTL